MFPLVETIRYESGTLHLLDLHQERLDRSRAELFGSCPPLLLASAIQMPDQIDPNRVYKVRVVYSQTIEAIEWSIYEQKPIRSLRLISDDSIDYHLKSTDRTAIDRLDALKNGADSIVVVKRGTITDSTYANTLFFDGTHWITPSTPLLKGVMRQHLLRENRIKEQLITVKDLPNFSHIKLINAMIPFDSFQSLKIDSILNFDDTTS